MYQLYLKKV